MRVSRLFLALTVASLLIVVPACKKPGTTKAGKQQKVDKKSAAAEKVPAPKELIASFSLRAPASTLDEGLALLNQFGPVPFDRQGLLDLLLQRAHLHRSLLDALDLSGTFWLLRLDDRAVGEKDPMAVVLPLRSVEAFKKALLARMDDKGKDGKLTIYRPKEGQIGLTETRVWFGEKRAIVPSSRKVYKLLEGYLQGTLTQRVPRHDAELRVFMANLLRGSGQQIDQSLDIAMARLKQQASRPGAKVDSKPAAGALERTARRYYALLKSAAELRFTADIDKTDIRLRLAAHAADGGKLAKLIKRQQPGVPFGQGLLPASTWALFANRGQPLVENDASPLDVALHSVAAAMRSPYKEQFQAAVQNARKHFEEDLTIGLYKPPSGAGLTVALLTRVNQAEPARQATAALSKVLADWMADEAKRSGKPAAAALLKPKARDFVEGEAKGRIYELTLPAEDMKARERLDALFGARLTAGWLVKGELAAFVAGKDTEARMKAIAKAGAKGSVDGNLGASAPFKAALTVAGLERVGLLYVSPVDLVRGLAGLGIAPLEPIAADLAQAQVQRAPALSWGVDGKRQAFVVDLALPASHFLHFKAFLAAVRKQGVPGLPR